MEPSPLIYSEVLYEHNTGNKALTINLFKTDDLNCLITKYKMTCSKLAIKQPGCFGNASYACRSMVLDTSFLGLQSVTFTVNAEGGIEIESSELKL